MFYYGIDPTYILVLIGVVICSICSSRMNSTFMKYSREANRRGLTGKDVARRILEANGIFGVTVQPCNGNLTDNYNPKDKTVNLSQPIYNGTSVAALGVAAHECGHAIQDNIGYAPLRLRSAFAPVASFGSSIAWPLVIVGIILGGFAGGSAGETNIGGILITIGITAFLLAVIFQLITLPVEYNASRRALKQMEDLNLVDPSEKEGAKKVLDAAALTYVASAGASILQFLRVILLTGGRRRRS